MPGDRPPRLFARQALTGRGWQSDVLVSVGPDGLITGLADHVQPPVDAPGFDILLPGMPNLHSHAFQRAMAGLTETASPDGRDNFWSWREVMYAFTRRLTPEHVEVIARALYIDLLKHGYTAVGEFHYLHHDPQGQPYTTPTELSDRVIAAARAAGIHITHLPVLYQTGDFGGVAPREGQRRFIHTTDSYLALVEALAKRYVGAPDVVLGVAPHSLRAVTPQSLRVVLEALHGLGLGACPVHVHVAEQEKEVADCLSWSGHRPVDWLLGHAPANARWCLVHATHMTPEETRDLARSGATAGLCPSTEANLGDGVFPALAYLDAGGHFGIGSDSNVGVNPYAELGLLEYVQRLTLRRRAVLHTPVVPSVGCTLYTRAAAGGARALGMDSGRIALGCRADLVALAADDPLLGGREGDRILDTLVFATVRPPVTDVFVAGHRVVQDGRHAREEESARALREVLRALTP
jgi:formimidoylglutamate deiminase